METEAEMGGMQPPAQEPPEAGRGRKNPPLGPHEGGRPCDTMISDMWPQEDGGVSFHCSEPPGLWYFVPAARGKSFSGIASLLSIPSEI